MNISPCGPVGFSRGCRAAEGGLGSNYGPPLVLAFGWTHQDFWIADGGRQLFCRLTLLLGSTGLVEFKMARRPSALGEYPRANAATVI